MDMGIGELGKPGLILKRKFRYTLSIEYECRNYKVGDPAREPTVIPEYYVKLAARPQLEIDEVELNYLNGVTWVPGKGRWQPITVTYVDAATADLVPLYSWIATVYDFTQKNARLHLPQSEKSGWNGIGTLKMWDGCGSLIETWTLRSMWPQSVNFGDLDYANSEEATIEMTMRYSEVEYEAECGGNPHGCCEGCADEHSGHVY
jgi:hypothetical protein